MDFRKLRKDQRNNPLKKDVQPHSHAEHKEHLQSTSFGSRTCYPFYPVIVLNSLDLVEVSLTTHRRIYLQINLKYTPLLVNSLYPFVPFQNLSLESLIFHVFINMFQLWFFFLQQLCWSEMPMNPTVERMSVLQRILWDRKHPTALSWSSEVKNEILPLKKIYIPMSTHIFPLCWTNTKKAFFTRIIIVLLLYIHSCSHEWAGSDHFLYARLFIVWNFHGGERCIHTLQRNYEYIHLFTFREFGKIHCSFYFCGCKVYWDVIFIHI